MKAITVIKNLLSECLPEVNEGTVDKLAVRLSEEMENRFDIGRKGEIEGLRIDLRSIKALGRGLIDEKNQRIRELEGRMKRAAENSGRPVVNLPL